MYGYQEYLNRQDPHIKIREAEVVLRAISNIREKFNVEIPRENCTAEYILHERRVIYNKPVFYISGDTAFDKHFQCLGSMGRDVFSVGEETAYRVYLSPLPKPQVVPDKFYPITLRD